MEIARDEIQKELSKAQPNLSILRIKHEQSNS